MTPSTPLPLKVFRKLNFSPDRYSKSVRGKHFKFQFLGPGAPPENGKLWKKSGGLPPQTVPRAHFLTWNHPPWIILKGLMDPTQPPYPEWRGSYSFRAIGGRKVYKNGVLGLVRPPVASWQHCRLFAVMFARRRHCGEGQQCWTATQLLAALVHSGV